MRLSMLVQVVLLGLSSSACAFPQQGLQRSLHPFSQLHASSSRENEIKRKIQQLKREGKMGNTAEPSSSSSSSSTSYDDKIRQKLGASKSKLLGFETQEDDTIRAIQTELDDEGVLDEEEVQSEATPRARIGSLPLDQTVQGAMSSSTQDTTVAQEVDTMTTGMDTFKKFSFDPSIFPETRTEEPEMSEEELLELVAQKLAEKQQEEARQRQAEQLSTVTASTNSASETVTRIPEKTTSGVGGTWQKDDDGPADNDLYKPKSGSWGAFPRPRNISTAYGGGRRVGAGYSDEDKAVSELKTKELLKEYRRKVGIDVPSEKENAQQIDEALKIAQLAMQRGIYMTAVTSLEKVTKFCSTNSPVGSKVFLELAMAYEASGRTQEAYQVYKTLSTCRMEAVKFQARRLLYGLEAMEFMKGVSSDFSRQKIRNTFIDTTGLGNIAENFDDRYNTAYVDLDNGFYKRLTESVVRSSREARQILLQAKGKDEVPRMKIIQALRSMSRHFDDAIEKEIEKRKQQEPTAYINGKPLLVAVRPVEKDTGNPVDQFVLATPEQMIENLNGSWMLQLLADKTGDGVSFFNTTLAVQEFRIVSEGKMVFRAEGPSGLAKVLCCGKLEMDERRRVISRSDVTTEAAAGSMLGMFGSNKNGGFLAAVSRPQQVISVDSTLLITKAPFGSRKDSSSDPDKEYFGVWRKQ